MNAPDPPVDSSFWMPHQHCVMDDASVIFPSCISGLLVFLAYTIIPCLLWGTVVLCWRSLTRATRGLIAHAGAFILSCGLTHLAHAWNWFHADYRAEMDSVALTAVISVTFIRTLWRYLHRPGFRQRLSELAGPVPFTEPPDIEDDVPFR